MDADPQEVAPQRAHDRIGDPRVGPSRPRPSAADAEVTLSAARAASLAGAATDPPPSPAAAMNRQAFRAADHSGSASAHRHAATATRRHGAARRLPSPAGA